MDAFCIRNRRALELLDEGHAVSARYYLGGCAGAHCRHRALGVARYLPAELYSRRARALRARDTGGVCPGARYCRGGRTGATIGHAPFFYTSVAPAVCACGRVPACRAAALWHAAAADQSIARGVCAGALPAFFCARRRRGDNFLAAGEA